MQDTNSQEPTEQASAPQQDDQVLKTAQGTMLGILGAAAVFAVIGGGVWMYQKYEQNQRDLNEIRLHREAADRLLCEGNPGSEYCDRLR